jgi:hypothetical protein
MTDTVNDEIRIIVERPDANEPEGVKRTSLTVSVNSLPEGQSEHEAVGGMVATLLEQLNG